MSKIEQPINGHPILDPFTWLVNIIVQPRTGEGSSPANGEHFQANLDEIRSKLVERIDVANRLDVTESNKVLDARQAGVLVELINEMTSLVWQVQVEDEKATPTEGRFIVADGATGDWAGHEGEIVDWDGEWQFTTPENGWAIYLEDRGELWAYHDGWRVMANLGKIRDYLLQTEQARDDVLLDSGFQAVAGDLTGSNKIGNVSDHIEDIIQVAAIHEDVTNVAGIKTEVENVSAIRNNVTAVDENKTNINAVKNNETNINNVANNKNNIDKVATIDTDVTKVANIDTDVTKVANIDTDVTDVADIDQEVADVAGIKSEVEALFAIKDNIVAVDANKANINAVHANKTNIDAVALNETNINAVHANKNNIDTVATNISNVNKVGAIDQDVTDVAGIKDDVPKVADIDGDVSKVANIDTDVSAVANIDTDVTDVASIKQDVSDVAGIKTAVSNLSPIKDNIVAVDGNKANINAVKANETNINAVKANETNINAVAGNSTNINAVKNNETNINAVANNKNNIDKVANINNDVTKVANIDTDVSAVALIDDDVTDVALIKQDVTDVAGIKTNVTNVAGIKDNVVAVDGNKANINAVHANKTNIDAVAGNKTNIDAVKNNSANINTVAGNLSGANTIGTVAGSISNVNNVGGNIGNVNAVASNKSNIDAVAGNKSNIDTVAGMKDNINALAPHSQAVADLGARTAELELVAEALGDIESLEKTANKKSTLSENSEIYYPNQKAVNDGLNLTMAETMGFAPRNLMDVFGTSTVSDTFQALRTYCNQDGPNKTHLDGFRKLRLGDYIDLPSLTIGADSVKPTVYPARTITNDYNRLRMEIVGFDDYYYVGDTAYPTQHHVTMMFKDIPTTAPFNETNVTTGDYPGSMLFRWLHERFEPALISAMGIEPRAVNRRIGTVDKWGWVGSEKIFLPTNVNIFGTPGFSHTNYGTGTQTQFALFAMNPNRKIKRRNGSRSYWWLAEPSANSSTDFCAADYGIASSDTARTACGVVPAFLI